MGDDIEMTPPVESETDHWNASDARSDAGLREFWLAHPRVNYHYKKKALVEGLPWYEWVVKRFQGPAAKGLELGCGRALALRALVDRGVMSQGFGLDLHPRFQVSHPNVHFMEADVNTIQLEENTYDLIFALQSFHHFEALERIMTQVHRALTPRGVFVLDEYVGPARFQWTVPQVAWASHLLALMPRELRMYSNGMEKREQGRSTVQEVTRVCASEAMRSNEIPGIFAAHFKTVAQCNLGGTIQHLLYSGIIRNFPDDDPTIDHLIDSIDAIETSLIGYRVLPSDFLLLIGEK
jgi:SAM-dependent methyltransferase